MNTAPHYGDTTIPSGFVVRKSKILSDLSVPDSEYKDLSPKGSVDEGIRDLIGDINALDGLVTTSSCAGRVSIFVEGSQKTNKKRKTDNANTKNSRDIEQAAGHDHSQPEDGRIDDRNEDANEELDTFANSQDNVGRKFAPSGGKGEGRWLYVSHDPVDNNVQSSFHELFGLVPGDGVPRSSNFDSASMRLIRFHYDPMILHVMAATLYHAHPVLAAASHAGFRESGLQSLRCLDFFPSSGSDTHSPLLDHASHSPIVAVRSAGLALESVIGYCEDSNDNQEPIMRSLVTEEYLRMLVALANERFKTNKDRVWRFQTRLLHLYKMALAPQAASRTTHKKKPSDWEDPQARRERKRLEGLERQAEKARQKEADSKTDSMNIDLSIGF